VSGHRYRTISPHTVTVLELTTTQSGTLGTRKSWLPVAGRLPMPCRLTPFSATEMIALAQETIRTVFRVRFPANPSLDGTIHRLKVTSHPTLAGRVLRIDGEPIDPSGTSWGFQVIASYHKEDQQATVALMEAINGDGPDLEERTEMVRSSTPQRDEAFHASAPERRRIARGGEN
jgi:hypothetical protein